MRGSVEEGLKTKDPGTSRGRGLKGPFGGVGFPFSGHPPCATDTWRIPLRGRHLHGTVFTFYHWTTSFLGVSLIGGPQPARSRGPPKPLGTATSLQGGGVDPRHNNMLG
jgi:hypothetical protein